VATARRGLRNSKPGRTSRSLWIKGATFQQIAAAGFGIATASGAWHAVHRALARIPKQPPLSIRLRSGRVLRASIPSMREYASRFSASICNFTGLMRQSFIPVIVVPESAFRLIKGELKYHAVVGDSGNEVGRGFCASCGAPIATRLAAMPDVMAIKAASLDEPARFKPTMNIYLSSAQPWAQLAQGLQNFEKMPG
jgi:hypothetical protein